MTVPSEMEEGHLVIDIRTGELVSIEENAADWLGGNTATLVGRHLHAALEIPKSVAGTILQALKAQQAVWIPPFLVRSCGSAERILDARVQPAAVNLSRLVLRWRREERMPENLALTDTLAVLAVDGFGYTPAWDIDDTARLMMGVHRSLKDILRKSDSLSMPSLGSLAIVIRDSSTDDAEDICLALLSHLHGDRQLNLTQKSLRVRLGLARRTPDASTQATLLAARYAVIKARAEGDSIRHAQADDYAQLIGDAVTESSVLHGPLFGPSPAGLMNGEMEIEESIPVSKAPPPVAPIERGIEGYVADNMEGAVDQALFLAGLDLPVAVIGPAGTGKMYIARVIHEASGGINNTLLVIDCREFRSRNAAQSRIAQELAASEGRTLVFKSLQLVHADVQIKLARQISSRTLADVSPPQYLPRVKLIALFPEPLEVLMGRGELTEALASAFAGYPIHVPPIRDRQQAVLRWAHKILGQEGALRDRDMKGFTPDAEQAMLLYDWPGNISEMRQCIHDALDKTDKDWLTPVDLSLYKGISAQGALEKPMSQPFLTSPQLEEVPDESYRPTTLEAVRVALGEAVHNLLGLKLIKPLGLWVDDELVMAALDRYRGDMPRAAEFLHTRSRNISRWMPKICAREDARNNSSLWQEPRRLLREWVRESPPLQESPQALIGDTLLFHLTELGGDLSVAKRAKIVGVSTPTYMKRLREQQDRQQRL
ncbi:MAG: sigma 54-interacting transcriptional regulator [Halioglobus sp.]|nr:sigma 54-interacting transcriptional regulator [Halioglobus sp.]